MPPAMSYVYDSAGRRVSATEGTNQRMFLVTPAMGSGLESTDLMTDGAGNLISNYIYAGGSSPFMRLDANGNPVYYLTDGMGSVIGLADGVGASTAKFGYDAFGNVRTSQGVGADATGGDFRFQGQWLESATGIYNFRARDYDSRTGTFLSRDPVDPISTEPESFNPYQFEYNNPFVYSDPTGMFTILEVNATQAVQNGLQNARTYALRELKEKAVESAQDFAADFAVSALRSILPIDIPGYLKNFSNIPVRQGNLFEAVARGALCQILTSIGADDWMWNEAKIKPDGRGTPVRPGYRCSDLGDIAAMRRGMYGGSRGNFPDFLFKQEEPTDTSSRGYLIGDFKRSTETVYREIKDPNNTQWKAIKGYAKNQQYIPVVAFVTYIHDKKKVKVSQLRKEFIEQGLIATVESFVNGKGNFF